MTLTSSAHPLAQFSFIINATPFTWSVHSGTLPPGLSLSSAGAITGTPTAAGTFHFTLKVVDARRRTARQAQSITIAQDGTVSYTQPNQAVDFVQRSGVDSLAVAIGNSPGA